MKPISLTTSSSKRFPLVDCNYQPISLSGYHGRCAKIMPSRFRNISSQYFQREARRDFISEAFFFAVLTITAAVPLVRGANAVVEFWRALGQL
jgi:hypothetical protein